MCGRAACTLSPEDLKRIFGLSKYEGEVYYSISNLTLRLKFLNLIPGTSQEEL